MVVYLAFNPGRLRGPALFSVNVNGDFKLTPDIYGRSTSSSWSVDYFWHIYFDSSKDDIEDRRPTISTVILSARLAATWLLQRSSSTCSPSTLSWLDPSPQKCRLPISPNKDQITWIANASGTRLFHVYVDGVDIIPDNLAKKLIFTIKSF